MQPIVVDRCFEETTSCWITELEFPYSFQSDLSDFDDKRTVVEDDYPEHLFRLEKNRLNFFR